MAETKPGRGSDQFPLRLPDGMRERIKSAAAENGRSMNAEIVETLREAYPDPEPDAAAEEMIALFKTLPEEHQKKFLREVVLKEFSEDEIRDGLVPGVRLVERTVDDPAPPKRRSIRKPTD